VVEMLHRKGEIEKQEEGVSGKKKGVGGWPIFI
jgi:hypothetical protein